MSDRVTPTLPSRDLAATSVFYICFGFHEVFRDAGWLIVARGALQLEFFPHPDLDPWSNYGGCCLRVDDARAIHDAFATAGLSTDPRAVPRLTPPGHQLSGFLQFALVYAGGKPAARSRAAHRQVARPGALTGARRLALPGGVPAGLAPRCAGPTLGRSPGGVAPLSPVPAPMTRPPRWFTVVAIVALLWNLLGCLAFASDAMRSTADVAQLPAAQQALYAARPTWAVAATGVAVIGGALGCIGLLMGRRWSIALLVLSLVGIVLQDVGRFILADGLRLVGPVAADLQGILLLVGIGLVVIARRASARGWLA